FFLKNFIARHPEIFRKEPELIVILSAGNNHYEGMIRKYVKPVSAVPHFFYAVQYSERPFLMQLARNVKKMLLLRAHVLRRKKLYKRVSENKNQNLIFTTYPSTWSESTKEDVFLDVLMDESKDVKPSFYIPFFYDMDELRSWNWNLNPPEFLRAFPNTFQLMVIFLSSLVTQCKIKGVKIIEGEGDEMGIMKTVLKTELLKIASGYDLFVMEKWLLNYFRSIKQKSNLFYQDEVYISGRIISKAFAESANKKIIAYGVQHCVIYDNFGPYQLTDEEISSTSEGSENGLPLPSYFLMWGSYFKNLFLKRNKLPETFAIISGDLRFAIKYEKRNEEDKRFGSDDRMLTLLWCTTLYEHCVSECEYFKNYLRNDPRSRLVIRQHPNSDNKEQLKELMGVELADKIEFSDYKGIFEDFYRADVILATANSTVFIDALVAGKPVVRLHIEAMRYGINNFRSDLLFDVSSILEFEQVVIKLKKDRRSHAFEPVSGIDQLLLLDTRKWKEIIKN
ncbi:MAG: hypothetical protein ACHQRM_12680, partial [Bacteroidia bacterium]